MRRDNNYRYVRKCQGVRLNQNRANFSKNIGTHIIAKEHKSQNDIYIIIKKSNTWTSIHKRGVSALVSQFQQIIRANMKHLPLFLLLTLATTLVVAAPQCTKDQTDAPEGGDVTTAPSKCLLTPNSCKTDNDCDAPTNPDACDYCDFGFCRRR